MGQTGAVFWLLRIIILLTQNRPYKDYTIFHWGSTLALGKDSRGTGDSIVGVERMGRRLLGFKFWADPKPRSLV